MGKVEAQTIRRDEGTALLNVVAQAPPQRGVQEVGCAVVANDVPASRDIDFGAGQVTTVRTAFHNFANMHDETADRLACILDLDQPTVAANKTAVAHLPARLDVKGSLGQYYFHFVAGNGFDYRLRVLQQRQQSGVSCGRAIWIIYRFGLAAQIGEHSAPGLFALQHAHRLAGATYRRVPLLRGLEAGEVDRHVALGCDIAYHLVG